MNNYGKRPPDYYSIYKLPQTELIKLVYLNNEHEVLYIIMSDKYGEEYYLYIIKNKKAKKIKTQKHPIFTEIEKAEKAWQKKCEKDGDDNATDI